MLKDGTYWAEQIRLGVITSQELLLEINQRVMLRCFSVIQGLQGHV